MNEEICKVIICYRHTCWVRFVCCEFVICICLLYGLGLSVDFISNLLVWCKVENILMVKVGILLWLESQIFFYLFTTNRISYLHEFLVMISKIISILIQHNGLNPINPNH